MRLQKSKATADTSKPLKPGCFYMVRKDIATSSLSGCNSLAEIFAFCSSGTRGEKNDSQRSSPTISSFYGWESNCKKSRCEKSLGQDNVRKKMPCIACHPLTFGVSYNPGRSFTWMETCHLAISQNQTGFHVSGAYRAIYSAFHWRRSHQAEKS